MRKTRLTSSLVLLLALVGSGAAGSPQQQKLNKADLETVRQILHNAHDVVQKNYYDPEYHGLDLHARLGEYDERIKNAGSLGDAFGVVAGFLKGLKDSHTYFSPPSRASRMDYGYRMQMIGDKCFITLVRPDTDAESKVHPGDQVVTYDGYDVNRSDFHSIRYYFNVLAPQPASKLNLRDPAGNQREILVNSKVQELKRVMGPNGFGRHFRHLGDGSQERE